MGLDQYIYRIRKPKLENRAYTADEIEELHLSKALAKNVEANKRFYAALLHYAVKRDYTAEYFNVEKMITDYNLPQDSHITMIGGGCIGLTGYDKYGNPICQKISIEEVEAKYIVTKTYPAYFWEEDEVEYWRKNYDLQEYMCAENTQYVMLDANLITRINERFGCAIPLVEPNENEAMFYWEWY
jgi:hypothetical protein